MKLNAIVKIICITVISSLAVFLDNVLSLAAVTVFSLAFLVALKVGAKDFYRKSRYYLKLVLVIALVQSIFARKGKAILSVRGFAVLTDYGIISSVKFILRSIVIISSALIMTTSDMSEMTTAMTDMRIPYTFAFLTSVAFSSLPKLRNEFMKRLEAVELRGITIRDLKFKEKIEIYSYLIAPTVQGLIIKSSDMANSLYLRGLGLDKKRTNYRKTEFHACDYLALSVIIIALAAILYLHFTVFRGLFNY